MKIKLDASGGPESMKCVVVILSWLLLLASVACETTTSESWAMEQWRKEELRWERFGREFKDKRESYERFREEVYGPLLADWIVETRDKAWAIDDGISDPISVARAAIALTKGRTALREAFDTHPLNSYRGDPGWTSNFMAKTEKSLIDTVAGFVLERRREQREEKAAEP